MVKLSLVIITKNEEKHIGDCILSTKDLVDEIVVLDDYSSDRTPDIVLEQNGIFHQQKLIGFGIQKQKAVSLATHDWVLCLDADERISDELYHSISAWKKNPSLLIKGYSFNRLSFYCGKAIKTCGWYPNDAIRLFDKRFGHWNNKPVHEGVEMNQGVKHGFLEGDLIHYTMESVEEHIFKTKKYASIKGQDLKNRNFFYLFSKLMFNPFFVFFKMFILKKGFSDGIHGFNIARISAWGEVWIYTNALSKIKK